MPVFSACAARTRRRPLIEFGVLDILAISYASGDGVDIGEGILENRLFIAFELTCDAVAFPQDAVFTEREDELFATAVNEHALKYFVQIESLGGHVLEVPVECAVIGIYGNG